MVAGLHDSGTAARNDGEPHLADAPGHLACKRVVRMLRFGARTAEERDSRSKFRKGTEALNELRLNAHDPPRIGVNPIALARVLEEPLVRGLGGALFAAQENGALAVVAQWSVKMLFHDFHVSSGTAQETCNSE